MNGASIVMVIVLLVALAAGMVFLVDQLNRNAEEIMAAHATIQDLLDNLEKDRQLQVQTQLYAVHQQQVVDGLNVSLSQTSAALDQSQTDVIHLQQNVEDLNATVSQKSGELEQLGQAWLEEHAARTSAEQHSAALVEQARQLRAAISAQEDQLAALAVQKDGAYGKDRQMMQTTALVPVTGAGTAAGSGLPWALPAAGLFLAGGVVVWGRHERRVHPSAARAERVAIWMTPDQARTYAHFARSQSAKVS